MRWKGSGCEFVIDDEDFVALLRERIEAQKPRQAQRLVIPAELGKTQEYTRRAIAPIRPSDQNTEAERDFLFKAQKMEASRKLPPYYLIYFLLVDFLGFEVLGRFEKLAWSVPIDFNGRAFLIEHRKFGVGVFGRPEDGETATQIVTLIAKGVREAEPFFKWMAEQAIHASRFNVANNAAALFGRYKYMAGLYKSAVDDLATAEARHARDEQQREFRYIRLQSSKIDKTAHWRELFDLYCFPWVRISQHVSWLALGAIDAFFAWTEHIFVHLAIIQGKITTGDEVAKLMAAEWNVKFKAALDANDKESKYHFDKLVIIRQQLRNFVAHGTFGKAGEAFHFHSKIGAIPVTFDSSKTKRKFSLAENMAFDDVEAMASIENFVAHLWAGCRAVPRIYIQDSDLPLILPMASDGRYAAAMQSPQAMDELVSDLTKQIDAATNMDW